MDAPPLSFPILDLHGFNGVFPDNLESIMKDPGDVPMGELQARNPITQKVVWTVPAYAANDGGTLVTDGNLVFQGTASGRFQARAADSGKMLWSMDAQDGIASQPITYLAGGKQYVSIAVGFGGAPSLYGPAVSRYGWDYRTQKRRILTFMLDGKAALPPKPPKPAEQIVDDESQPIDPKQRARGRKVFSFNCLTCHGPGAISGGGAPDLRMSPVPTSAEAFSSVVHDGALRPNGMPQFDELPPEDVEAVRTYIRGEARRAMDKLRETPVR